MPRPAPRRWFSFSLRRMLLAFALLGVVCAVGRWYYVAVYEPDRELAALGGLGCRVVGVNWGPANIIPRRFRAQWTHVVTVVISVPFRSPEDAERVGRFLRRMPDLQHVSLRASQSTAGGSADDAQADAQAAAVLAGLTLQTVAVEGSLGQQTFRQLAGTRALDSVNLYPSPAPDDLRVLLTNKTLREIHLNRPDADVVAALAAAPALQRIYLSDPDVAGLILLNELPRAELQLTLSAANDDDLRAVARVRLRTNLDLFGCPVTDEGLFAFESEQTPLVNLHLKNLPIGDAALIALAELRTLELVRTSNCRGVSEVGAVALGLRRKRAFLAFSSPPDLARIRRDCPRMFITGDQSGVQLLRPLPE